LLLLGVAALHTLGMFGEPSMDPGDARLEEVMKEHTLDVGLGMTSSVHDIYMSLGLTMTGLMVFMGIHNIVIVMDAGLSAPVLRKSASVNALAMGALATLYYVYRVAPPLLSFIVLALMFAASYRTASALEAK
jgi:hypothetical protein